MKKEILYGVIMMVAMAAALVLVGWKIGQVSEEQEILRAKTWTIEQDLISNFIRRNHERVIEYNQTNVFRTALAQINPKDYNRQDNNCFDHSLALQTELRKAGIESSIFINENRNHAWVAVWVESTNGNFIHPQRNRLHPVEVRSDKDTVLLADPVKSKVHVSTGTIPDLWW
jgi:hypothetical protein